MGCLQSVLSFALVFCFFSGAFPAFAGLKKDIAALSGGRAEAFDWPWIESHASDGGGPLRPKGLNEKAAPGGQTDMQPRSSGNDPRPSGAAAEGSSAPDSACHLIFSTESPPREAALTLPLKSVMHLRDKVLWVL